ncbi:MAG: PadR family transcriptional regulator [Candidatus Bathyarchaeum sp.]|nr:MAG: PadR family transcriptional regulator [Candidatus Bathyarchaeum sp.]
MSDIIGDTMFERWMKRTAGVPRGLLRFLVLRLLAEKPMSGAEIVEEIEQETYGKWKPSPGSIYPLLAWLQDNGYTSESAAVESGMKRYVLTNKGKQFFEEQVKFGQKFLEKLEWLAPMLVGGFHLGTNHENLLHARQSAKKVLKTFIEFRAIKDSMTKQDVEEIAKILDYSNRQLKKIALRIKEKNQPKFYE